MVLPMTMVELTAPTVINSMIILVIITIPFNTDVFYGDYDNDYGDCDGDDDYADDGYGYDKRYS